MGGQFLVDPENSSPWVVWSQEVIWSENNPNHDQKNDLNVRYRAQIHVRMHV